MFQNAYQSGNFLELFDAKGIKENEKNNDKLLKIINANGLTKAYDRSIKSYIYDVRGGSKTKLQFPKDDRQELGLTQSFLVFQIFLPQDHGFSLELVITDTSKTKRRLIFTSSVKEIEKSHFHIKLPLDCLRKDTWLHLSFDLISFFSLFGGSTFRSLDGFILAGNFKLRKIFTMKNPIAELPRDCEGETLPYIESHIVSKALNFCPGVSYMNQLVNLNTIQKDYVDENTPSTNTSSSGLKNSFSTPSLSSVLKSTIRSRDNSKLKEKPRKDNSGYFIQENNHTQGGGQGNKVNTSGMTMNPHRPSVLSTNYSKAGGLVSPKRHFMSPTSVKSQLLGSSKKSNIENSNLGESILSPKESYFSSKIISPRGVSESNVKSQRPTSKKAKKKVPLLKILEKTKPQVSLNQSGKKAFSYSRGLRINTDFTGTTLPTEGNSIDTNYFGLPSARSQSDKNPWANDIYSLRNILSPKTATAVGNTSKVLTNSEIKSATLINESLSPQKPPNKVKLSRFNTCETPKDTLTTLDMTPRNLNYSSESDRFSSLTRAGEIRPRYTGGQTGSIKEDDEKDETESIEENLECEMNISGICRSKNGLGEDDGATEAYNLRKPQKKTKKEDNKNKFRVVSSKNNSIRKDEDFYYESVGPSMSNVLDESNESDGENTRRVINEVEEKVKNIMTNTRPFSPPFASKGSRQTITNY